MIQNCGANVENHFQITKFIWNNSKLKLYELYN